MMSPLHSLLVPLALVPLALSLPQSHIFARQNEGPGLHTLTAYAPNNTLYDGLKVEYSGNLNLFQARTGSYCPGPPNVPNCPNGTDTVFAGTFYPVRLQTSTIPTIKNHKRLGVLFIDCMI
jgi:hypothetical protein